MLLLHETRIYLAHFSLHNTLRQGAIVENGLTNEFVDMDTYQVLIQTLPLSERIRTGPEYSQRRSEDS